MGEFRTVQQIRALPDQRPQEEELLVKAEAGELLTLGDGDQKGKLPSAGDETRSIRAGIIRYLLLGGCERLRCHEKGVRSRARGCRICWTSQAATAVTL